MEPAEEAPGCGSGRCCGRTGPTRVLRPEQSRPPARARPTTPRPTRAARRWRGSVVCRSTRRRRRAAVASRLRIARRPRWRRPNRSRCAPHGRGHASHPTPTRSPVDRSLPVPTHCCRGTVRRDRVRPLPCAPGGRPCSNGSARKADEPRARFNHPESSRSIHNTPSGPKRGCWVWAPTGATTARRPSASRPRSGSRPTPSPATDHSCHASEPSGDQTGSVTKSPVSATTRSLPNRPPPPRSTEQDRRRTQRAPSRATPVAPEAIRRYRGR